ncbi:hypothetical protein EVAR_11557_1 [Eumeta japonica]|uniref:Uncharacterized protein n=1 Tax=Eumeta variegata TaxID=151549 RepID=A0A4C1TZJ3_EUMVA|nr:hypothetical protein EVAR_11557_1 [Eumeta japonica]
MKDFVYSTHTDAQACPNLLVGLSLSVFHYEPYGTDVVFDGLHRTNSYAEVISLRHRPLGKLRAVGTPACCLFAFSEAITKSTLTAYPTQPNPQGDSFSGFQRHMPCAHGCAGVRYAHLVAEEIK